MPGVIGVVPLHLYFEAAVYCALMSFLSPRWCFFCSWCQIAQNLRLSTEQIKYLCEEASRAGTQGQRAEIFACEVARASAGELLVI